MEVLLAAAVCLAAPGDVPAADVAGAAPYPVEVPAGETFDGRAFSYRIGPLADKPEFRIYRITYPSPLTTPVEQNNTVPADYYLPTGIGPGQAPRPAVICMHILDGDFELARIVCSALARRGIPAIMFKLPYYGERAMPGGPEAMARRPELFVQALDQAVLDVRRTVDVLASRPEVHTERIGITGISLGGIVAATAAGREPRIHRAAMILAGGDLLAIINHARETRVLKEMIAGLPAERRAAVEESIRRVDPLHAAAELRKRAQRGHVLMINAAEDEVIPPRCTEKLARALGVADRVVWFEGLGHYTAMAELPRALDITTGFFAGDMPPGVKAPTTPGAPRLPPLHLAASLAAEAVAMLTAEPAEGHCHLIDLELSITPRGKDTIRGRIRCVHGSGGRFRLECRVPGKLVAEMGQGRFPWMAGAEKRVFVGRVDPEFQPGDPLKFARAEHRVNLRMAAGAAAGAALAPDILTRWVTAADQPPDEGRRVIRLSSKQDADDAVVLTLAEDGRTPARATFDLDGTRGTVVFHGWRRDAVAHPALFDPPAELPAQEVDPADLYRVFSAMFNFAMEKMQ